LTGAGGEPISFSHTIASHGLASLKPSLPGDGGSYRIALNVADVAVLLTLRAVGAELEVASGPRLSAKAAEEALSQVRRIFRLDDDLSPFYAIAQTDQALAWTTVGAGRMLASPTVFEDVVKTICTTNCAWSGTIRMVSALVDDLGTGAFPSPERMAKAKESWYRDVARAGYRGAYLRDLARAVARGDLDLESRRPQFGASDAECEERLLALPGIGPYAAAHAMQLLGRHHRLILDSWTRPTYLRLRGKRSAKDTSIVRAFKKYGPYAGLAFWLTVTREWHP
jgi:3-methyladenine DNA glycosylase/8-oxoguanine DNA glycosylase